LSQADPHSLLEAFYARVEARAKAQERLQRLLS
jgi:hypothetical protein